MPWRGAGTDRAGDGRTENELKRNRNGVRAGAAWFTVWLQGGLGPSSWRAFAEQPSGRNDPRSVLVLPRAVRAGIPGIVARRRRDRAQGRFALEDHQELAEDANPAGDESAYVGGWAKPTTPHMPFSFLPVAFFSSLLGRAHRPYMIWEGPAERLYPRPERGPADDWFVLGSCSR